MLTCNGLYFIIIVCSLHINLDGQDESKQKIDDRICFNPRKSRSCESNVFFFNYIRDRYNIFLFIYKRNRYICMKEKVIYITFFYAYTYMYKYFFIYNIFFIHTHTHIYVKENNIYISIHIYSYIIISNFLRSFL